MQTFSFNKKNLGLAKKLVSNYPKGREQSAILPILDLAQRQNGGWLSQSAIECVADYLGITYVKAIEVASFYSMFNLSPVGKYHIQVCGTTPCWLNGAQKTMQDFEENLNLKCGQVTEDGMFSLTEVECLGACINAPVVQINDDYYENVEDTKQIIDQLRKTNQAAGK